MRLNLGCGQMKLRENEIGIDLEKIDGVIQHNLNDTPYPFDEGQFSEVTASHILEHLNDLPDVMKELYRITEKGGVIKIYAPYFTSVLAWTSLTHNRAFTLMSFNNMDKKSFLSKKYGHLYNDVDFEIIRKRLLFKLNKDYINEDDKKLMKLYKIYNFFASILESTMNKVQLIYENSFLCYLFPARQVYFELKKR